MRWSRIRGRAAPGRGRDRRGFTLLEALIALVIVGVAATMTMEAFAAGLRGQRQSSRSLAAVGLAEARMDELALVPRDSLSSYAEPRAGHFSAPFEGYRWRAQLREAAGRPALLEASVTVDWDEGTYTLGTVFYRPLRGAETLVSSPVAGR